MRFHLRKGLDLPLAGAPEPIIDAARPASSVALLTRDYPGLHPSLRVREGDRVELGQPLFHDRRIADVVFTSPGSGVVSRIHRGARRSLQAIVIDLEGDGEAAFEAFTRDQLPSLGASRLRGALLASGLWAALRARPNDGVANPAQRPRALFITATDTNPLAPAPHLVIDAQRGAFADGITALAQLVDAPVFLCKAPGVDIPTGDSNKITVAEFEGPHPSGLVGTHIHLLAPVSSKRTVWHIGYQDVIAIGSLLTTGRISVDRIVALAGPVVQRPRYLRTRLGAHVDDLVRDELHDVPCRVVSGSVLSGHTASASAAFLGRYHNQVSVLSEGRQDLFRGGLTPRHAWSVHRPFWPSRRRRALTTQMHGSAQAMIPVDTFEGVVPLDILPTPLLRSLLVGDTEMAEALGCLELVEEDLALCSFLCPAKNDYGSLLRSALVEIG